ncbi:MAG: discoidin domain-containing protein, partial [Nocardioides sp.]|nr:discoidin domain-containing protein [Nocardioides sp.]
APVEHGHVLRPRRVRAGIPRQLDALCDEVLNDTAPRQRSHHDLTTARGIADLLQEFVGDTSDLGPMGSGAPATTMSSPPVGPPAPEPAPPPVAPELAGVDHGAEADTNPDLPPAGPPEAPPATPPVGDDLATEAGMPVFHDDTDDVEWLRARSEPYAPPPPLEDAPARPLFAPDPPQGEPVRRPRAGSAAAAATGTDSGFWPWGSDTGTGTGTGSTGSGAWTGDSWGSNAWDTSTGEHVPGRSWFRLALVVGLGALVLLAAVAAYQLGLGSGADEPTPDGPTGGDNPSVAAPTPFTDLQASDFDPQGSPPRDEYPELVPLALDGDPGTAWNTATYKQNFGPGGLKTGVGIVVDLGEVRDVREVAVTVEGSSTVAAYVTETEPTGVAGLTPVGEATGDGDLTITLDEAVPGQYVTVWLTAIPRVDGGFRGTIAEIQVRG